MSKNALIGVGIIGILFPTAIHFDLHEAGACLVAGIMFIIKLK